MSEGEVSLRHEHLSMKTMSTSREQPPRPLSSSRPTNGMGEILSFEPGTLEYRASPLRRSLGSSRSYINRPTHPVNSTILTEAYSVQLPEDNGGVEMVAAHPLILRSMEVRDKYKSIDKGALEGSERLPVPMFFRVDDGIYRFAEQRTEVIPWEVFYEDVLDMLEVARDERSRAACQYRLQVLEEKYFIYKLYNGELECSNGGIRPRGGVFANSTKVDNCVCMNTMMNAQGLVDFIADTCDCHGGDLVAVSELEEMLSLIHMLEVWNVTDPQQITAEGIGLQPSTEEPSLFYDALNPELNCGGAVSAELLRLFLSRDTVNKGKYFADAVRPYLFRNPRKNGALSQATETVIEITGLFPDEWLRLAEWLDENDLYGSASNTYIISFNRQKIREMRRSSQHSSQVGPKISTLPPPSQYENHQEHFDSLFLPLFLATASPDDPKQAKLAKLLSNIGGFLIVFEDEEIVEALQKKRCSPVDVPWSESVGDLYFAYYVWANLCSLNCLRSRKNMNAFRLRSVAGSQRASSNADSIVVSFILCDSIVNGIALEHQPVMQYLYRLKNVGISMHPLTNAGQGMDYSKHVFSSLFRRGLKVSLCTVDPLFYHHGENALVEEYGTASKLYRMSGVDMSEIALNSVSISTFSPELKREWLGEAFISEGIRGNNVELTAVPNARLEFRADTWNSELDILLASAKASSFRITRGNVENSLLQSMKFESSQNSRRESGSPDTKPSKNAKLITAPYAVIDTRVDFHRLRVSGTFEKEAQDLVSAHFFQDALELRSRYTGSITFDESSVMADLFKLRNNGQIELAFSRNKTNSFDEDEWTFKTVEGILVPHEVHQIPRLPKDMFHYEDFRSHVQEIRDFIDKLAVQNFSMERLKLLEHKFKLHSAVNHSLEAGSTENKASQNRDFYQATKVDNTIRMETGMTARQLLDFIVSKAHNNGDDIVAHQSGKEPQTLRQLLSELRISPDSLTVDNLNVQANSTLGTVSEQYIPEGRDELLTLLLKTDNQMKGRYFAELTKLTFENLKRDRFTFTENRLPIYGASEEEWVLVSTWFDTHGMSSSHNQWMIQIPRIYGYLRKKGKVASFAEYIENIFKPLWSVSLHPSKDPRLFHFVNHISGFDCIENEQRMDIPLSMATTPPHEWTGEADPPYNYYMYHIWANISTLNKFRARRQFSTFSFRPSCGEAGQIDHLVGAFLLSNGISYGIQLGDNAPMQYLFYLAQIGVTVSPLSNNTKVLDYLDNPFPQFFRRGLRVTLGTDSPLMYHHTQEPLLEEYSIASKIWKLSPNDMCEIARNSVLVSGFSPFFKQERLGKLYFLSSSESNDSSRTHLSDDRVGYRFETYHTEIGYLEYVSGQTFQKSMLTLAEEEVCKAKFLELESMTKKGAEYHGIIDVHPDQEELTKLLQQHEAMESELRELIQTMTQLQQDNRLITEKLVVERKNEREEQVRMRTKFEEEVVNKSNSIEISSEIKQSCLQTTVEHPNSTHLGAVEFSKPIEKDFRFTKKEHLHSPTTASSPSIVSLYKTDPLLMHHETLWSEKGSQTEKKLKGSVLPSL